MNDPSGRAFLVPEELTVDAHDKQTMGWGRFAAMVVTSTVIMFFLMYQLVYGWDHALFSLTRLISSLVMGCVMVAVMLVFMWPMYRPRLAKLLVLAVAVVGGAALLAVNREQMLVGDAAFMKAMIPHHSIAINNARKADIRDPRVRYLADRITRDQVKEIAEMKMLLANIERHGRRGDAALSPGPAKLTREGIVEARDLVSGKLLSEKPL